MSKQQTLDQQIAAALAQNGRASKSELAELIRLAEEAIAEAQQRIEVESERALDLSNDDPSESQALVVKAELRARGLTNYTAEQPQLREHLALPDFHASRDRIFPPRLDWGQVAYAALEPALTAMARKEALACGPNWHEAEKVEQERLRQEALKRDEQLREQAAKDKDEYHRSFWKLSENHV